MLKWEVLLDAGNFDTYNWSTGALTQTTTVDSSGVGLGVKEVWCRVSDENGYQWDTVFITFKDCSAIDDLAAISDIRVFPNPSGGDFTLSLQSIRKDQISMKLIGIDGRIQFRDQHEIVAGENMLRINNTGMQNGIYMLHLEAGGVIRVMKVIVNQ